ncbi:hydrogenase maturation protease [Planotetraspora sp. A-T 1434]|uniref:hydrogenase maturation protease n=1 Tax=Planotetraspora sp. A-T 1434 TaxID=2979219 RepID=UPI0021BE6970|nr:hydrogenase maturation protease [Planotetraspora sp. A-T 1434]MCT9933728.1 hydrogenase maturation protease [Planotetraspora sp. A-T 1434]
MSTPSRTPGKTPGRTVVIGLGGDARGDDAAGLEVVRLLRDTLPPSVAVVENAGDPAELIDSWTGTDLAIVIDAVSSGAAPGTVHRHTDIAGVAGVAGVASWHGSSHSFGLADAIDLGRALGRLPGELVVLGIEGDDFTIGAPMTPPVRAAVRHMADAMRTLFYAPKVPGRCHRWDAFRCSGDGDGP